MMIFLFEKMNEQVAKEILSWKYDEPYDFYNIELTPEAVQEMLNNSYFAVFDTDKRLVGFFCLGGTAQVPNDIYTYTEGFVDVGIGMKPELTGKGFGTPFFSQLLNYINELYGIVPLRLTVAQFNQRAIHLYEKFGFRIENEFKRRSVSFITMLKLDE